jgi:hypothetical protein
VEYPIRFVDRQHGKSKMRPAIVTEALRVVWALHRESSSRALAKEASPS